MKFIKKCNAENFSWDNIENNVIGNFPWDSTGYTPKTTVKVAVLEEGLKVKFTGTENEVIINNTELHSRVYQDSCVEFFVNPDFENSNDYINIEINALGTALSQIGPDAIEREFLTAGDIRSLNITTDITSENVREFDGFKPWNLEYLISFDLIEKYYPKFDRNNLKSIKCNFYKCGDKTKEKHYGCLFNIKYRKPSFHRPEFFKEILVK